MHTDDASRQRHLLVTKHHFLEKAVTENFVGCTALYSRLLLSWSPLLTMQAQDAEETP